MNDELFVVRVSCEIVNKTADIVGHLVWEEGREGGIISFGNSHVKFVPFESLYLDKRTARRIADLLTSAEESLIPAIRKVNKVLV